MLMSPHLFLDCILCVINDNSEDIGKLVNDLISLYESDVKTNTTIDNDLTRFYIKILKSIILSKATKENPDELRLILLKFQSDPSLSKRKEIYELLHETFLSKEKLPVEKINQCITQIENTLLWNDLNKSTRSQFAALSRSADMINPVHQAEELQKVKTLSEESVTCFQNKKFNIKPIRTYVEKIDFTDKDSMKAALVKHNDRAVTGIMRMGLAGFNRMCGERGGLARGESLVIYALKHNYKSSLLMSISTWAALYNTPSSSGSEGNKKKLILMISLENEAYQNFVWMFRHHYENLNQRSSKGLTDDQVADWCYSKFSENGYSLIIERYLPRRFTYAKYVEIIEYYENSGYEIVLTSVDYLNLAEKSMEGIRNESNHLAVQAIFSAFCNYNKSKGITFTTAHPLNRSAAALRATGVANVVKRFDENHLADSVDVAREVDLEMYINIERNLDGVPYLTCNRGKHRYVDNTPDNHKYFAYPFYKNYGIKDDVLLKPGFVNDIYAEILTPDVERGTPNQASESSSKDDISVF